MSLCYGFDCPCARCNRDPAPLDPSLAKLVVGEQFRMNVDGSLIRVLLVSLPEVNENNELRAHVVVLEDNLYVRAGAECRPLAHTLVPA